MPNIFKKKKKDKIYKVNLCLSDKGFPKPKLKIFDNHRQKKQRKMMAMLNNTDIVLKY